MIGCHERTTMLISMMEWQTEQWTQRAIVSSFVSQNCTYSLKHFTKWFSFLVCSVRIFKVFLEMHLFNAKRIPCRFFLREHVKMIVS